jgi:uncharacterized membrane protein YgcG
MHHVHMSTEFMFLLAFFVIGLLAVVFAFVISLKRSKPEYLAAVNAANRTVYAPVGSGGISGRTAYAGSTPSAPSAPVGSTQATAAGMAAPVYVHGGSSGTDMMTGVLLGSVLSGGGHHHDTTVIHDTYSSPAPAAPSYISSSSSSSDSGGFTWSSSDSSSSYSDSGSGGGFDASF